MIIHNRREDGTPQSVTLTEREVGLERVYAFLLDNNFGHERASHVIDNLAARDGLTLDREFHAWIADYKPWLHDNHPAQDLPVSS